MVMLGPGSDAYDAVVLVDAGAHPLGFLQGTHAAVVQVSHGVASGHVTGLDVCVDGFEFEVHRTLGARRARPLLRGHVESPTGERFTVGARARDENERSFDLLAGAGRELTVVGSLRLGQRVLLGSERAARRDLWSFLAPAAA